MPMVFIGTPKKIAIEIFYQYNINLEDDYSDFGDLLEKALVLVKYRMFLAHLLQNKKTDLSYNYVEPQKNIFAIFKLVEPFANLVQDFDSSNSS